VEAALLGGEHHLGVLDLDEAVHGEGLPVQWCSS
jgi:hypothetical protein